MKVVFLCALLSLAAWGKSKKEPVRVEITSCSSCQLNKMPNLKPVLIQKQLAKFGNVDVTFVPKITPSARFFDEDGKEVEYKELPDKKYNEVVAWFKEMGFEPKLAAPTLKYACKFPLVLEAGVAMEAVIPVVEAIKQSPVSSFALTPIELPAGVQFDTSTGVFSGTPSTPADPAIYEVRVYGASDLHSKYRVLFKVNPASKTEL